MSEDLSQNMIKIAKQKRQKFEWGISEPIEQPEPNTKKSNLQFKEPKDQKQGNQLNPKAKLNPNGISFQDLPVKQSEIMTEKHKTHIKNQMSEEMSRRRERIYTQYTEISSDNKETVDKLFQLKNQFQILKGIMIDSRIEGNHKISQKFSNASQSNVRSSRPNLQLKTGQTIRAKNITHKNRESKKVSSSSISEKDINIRRSNLHQNIDIENINKKIYENGMDGNDFVKQSKISKSKHSQHRSQNPRDGHSRNHSRITQKIQKSGVNGFISGDLLSKHSVQLQLRNALEKIQYLLQNQILLKTKNNQLEQMIKNFISGGEVRQQKKDEKDALQNKLNEYEIRLQEQRSENRELIARIGKLQADYLANQAVINILKQERNQQLSNAMNYKLNVANLQIDIKRLQMEKDIDGRDYKYEIERLKNQNEVLRRNIGSRREDSSFELNIPITNFDKQRIKELQQQLIEKDRRYKQIIDDLQNKKYLKQEAQLLQIIQNLHKRKQQQGQSQISRQLGRLKQQIIKIKAQSDLTQSQFGFQSKVISLQQALKKDNEEKEKNLIQVQKFQKQYEILKQKLRQVQLEKEQQNLENERAKNKLKADLSQAELFKGKYEQVNHQNENLQIKIQELQGVIRKYEEIQNQMTYLRQALKKKDTTYSIQMKDAKRRVDQAEFQAFKSQQQSKLNLDLNSRKLQSHIQMLTNQLRSVQADRNYHRGEANNLRQQNQALVLRLKDLQFHRDNKIKYETHLQMEQKEKIRSQHLQQIELVSKKFLSEEQKLVQQISQLTRINEQLSQKLKKCVFLQSENLQLKQICRRKISAEASVFHLWEIKQVEYSNVNKALQYIKSPNNAFIQANRNLSNSNLYYENPNINKLNPYYQNGQKVFLSGNLNPQQLRGFQVNKPLIISQPMEFAQVMPPPQTRNTVESQGPGVLLRAVPTILQAGQAAPIKQQAAGAILKNQPVIFRDSLNQASLSQNVQF